MIINDYQSLTGTYAGGVFPSYLRRLSSCKDLSRRDLLYLFTSTVIL
jgi:hypothetical protein